MKDIKWVDRDLCCVLFSTGTKITPSTAIRAVRYYQHEEAMLRNLEYEKLTAGMCRMIRCVITTPAVVCSLNSTQLRRESRRAQFFAPLEPIPGVSGRCYTREL
ncbi:unnamed protein product [Hydatigera taeniaeformis]|uniref:Uncharacterized protein n=1 Tax=Hydatigena taeniaeformis TaxID=6205 RepID=A0A3P7GYX0_HYDTA|nr:unnamed protein product [Hydatigera taeniaeformis]